MELQRVRDAVAFVKGFETAAWIRVISDYMFSNVALV